MATAATLRITPPTTGNVSNNRLTRDQERLEHPGYCPYVMNPGMRRIAFIFRTTDSEEAGNDARTLFTWLEELDFIVIQPKCDAGDVKKYLQDMIKAVSLDPESDGSKNFCFFFAILCKPNTIDEEEVWKSLTAEESKCITRPKIFLLKEYPGVNPSASAHATGIDMEIIPSYTNFLFIHGSEAADYISKFTGMWRWIHNTLNEDLEINDFVVEVHANITVENKVRQPYYSSTLTNSLNLKEGRNPVHDEDRKTLTSHYKSVLEGVVVSLITGIWNDSHYLNKLTEKLNQCLPALGRFINSAPEMDADHQKLLNVTYKCMETLLSMNKSGTDLQIIRYQEESIRVHVGNIVKIDVSQYIDSEDWNNMVKELRKF